MSNGNAVAAPPDGKTSVWIFASRMGESIRHERNCRICDEYTRHILEADLNGDTSLAAAREALQKHICRELEECRLEITRLRKALKDYHTAHLSPSKTHVPQESNLSSQIEPPHAAVVPQPSAHAPTSPTSIAVNDNPTEESASPSTLLPQPRVSTTAASGSSDATFSLPHSAAQPTAGPSIPISLAAKNIVPIIKEEPDDLAFSGPLQLPTTFQSTEAQARSASINPSIQINLPRQTPTQSVVPTNAFDNSGSKVSIPPPTTDRSRPSVPAQGHGLGQTAATNNGGGLAKRPSRRKNKKKQRAGNTLQMIPENPTAARNSTPPVLASRITDSQADFAIYNKANPCTSNWTTGTLSYIFASITSTFTTNANPITLTSPVSFVLDYIKAVFVSIASKGAKKQL
ncbi:hypothetical protein PQX77_008319 [Marasmius sp. AFHP31]|nr:hypothetical protein PQX77_008319 [Marasmius sp. AFHP31]